MFFGCALLIVTNVNTKKTHMRSKRKNIANGKLAKFLLIIMFASNILFCVSSIASVAFMIWVIKAHSFNNCITVLCIYYLVSLSKSTYVCCKSRADCLKVG